MDNNADDFARPGLRSLFLEASRLPSASEQEAWLRNVCADDPDLRERVMQLLRSGATSSDSLLDLSVAEAKRHRKKWLSESQEDGLASLQLPTQVGPYRLEEKIGQGGMSVVYRAVQTQPLEREVAVKVLDFRLMGTLDAARFASEQRLLARLQHPAIAAIFDSGTTLKGSTYFVMEYIKGRPITQFCNDFRLNLRQRLQLIIQVCEAVAYAHQQGVLHRDLKPSNILVQGDASRFQVKVIDFGLGKAFDTDSDPSLNLTATRQIVGTPLYMSPEQMRPGGESVDTRSDIYAIGCILYELLCGRAPFDSPSVRQLGFAELQKLICSDQDPPSILSLLKRSQSNNGQPAGDDPPSDSAHEQLPALSGRIGRELNWIVLKALHKEKDRRYSSATAFSEDLGRYLNSEPLLAGPPEFGYRFRKFLIRYRYAASLTVLSAVVLVAAAIISWRQAWITLEANRVAEQRLVQVELLRRESERQRESATRAGDEALAAKMRAEAARQESEQARQEANRERYLAEIRLASEAMLSGELSLAARLLQHHQPNGVDADWRGQEWHLLNDLLTRNPTWSVRQEVPFTEIAISPDHQSVAASADSGEVSIYSTDNGKLLDMITTNRRQLTLAWSPGGDSLAMGAVDGRIRLFRRTADPVDSNPIETPFTGNWRERAVWEAHPHWVYCIAFVGDGQHLLSGGDDGYIRLWKVDSGEMVAEMNAHDSAVEEVAISQEGKLVASAGSDGWLYVWTLPDFEPIESWKFDEQRLISVAFQPDSNLVAAGDVRGNLLLGDLATGKLFLQKSLEGIEKIQFLPDGRSLATADRGGNVQLWKLSATNGRWEIRPDFLRRWNVSELRAKSLGCLPDGSLVVADRTATLSRWPQQSSNLDSWTVPVHAANEDQFLMLDSQSLLIKREKLMRVNLVERTVVPWEGPIGSTVSLMARASDSEVIAASDAGEIIVYNPLADEVVQRWPMRESPSRLAISPDGTRVIAAFQGTLTEILFLEVGQEDPIGSYRVKTPSCLKFLPDGSRFGVGAVDELHLVRWGETRPDLKLIGHDSTLSDFLYLDQSNQIVTVSHDRRFKVWDAASGNLEFSAEAHSDAVYAAA
jgi:eukaryotic-like serine/threonine-protein kinase